MKLSLVALLCLMVGGPMGTLLAQDGRQEQTTIGKGDYVLAKRKVELSNGKTVEQGEQIPVLDVEAGRLLLEFKDSDDVWANDDDFVKYTRTTEQKLATVINLHRSKQKYKEFGFVGRYLDKRIYEIPIEVQGKIHFVHFAFVEIGGSYPGYPDHPESVAKTICAVRKKDTLPSATNCFLHPSLVFDQAIDIKVDETLTSENGEVIKLPYEE
jgi:hypothetical protein